MSVHAPSSFPRVLEVNLEELSAGPRPLRTRSFGSASSGVLRTARLGGAALGLSILVEHRRARPDAPLPFCLSVGDCVRRGVPTAARVTVAGRAPLTGLYADGQVGGELGRRLATVADALSIVGSASPAGAFLAISAERVELITIEGLRGADPSTAARAVTERLGPCATICIGRAGEEGLPFASLSAGFDPPHLVGRGGLGSALGQLGLKGIAVTAPAVETIPDRGSDRLEERLSSSPRLEQRAASGTLELFDSLALRGARPLDALPKTNRPAGEATRFGCSGCPTPCGFVFRTESGDRQGARFSASFALFDALGLDEWDDVLRILKACDEAAMDAREVAALLALACAAHESGTFEGDSPRGDVDRLLEVVGDILARRGDGAVLSRGAAAAAEQLGLEPGSRTIRGAIARTDDNLATLLGQCVSSRGSDPMRTFPFLVGEGPSLERLRELVDPLPLPRGAEDPSDPTAKGRLVWWHENLATILDTSGFCAFSAAALIADSACTLDELAGWIAPEALREAAGDEGPGRAMLRAGAEIVFLQRELNHLLGAGAEGERPAWARADLDRPGMLDEYRTLRGLDGEGRPIEATRQAFEAGTAPPCVARFLREEKTPRPTGVGTTPGPRARRAPGTVLLHGRGTLGAELPEGSCFTLELPSTALEVLERAASARPELRPYLIRAGHVLPALYRDGARIGESDAVFDGDALDLLLAISGG